MPGRVVLLLAVLLPGVAEAEPAIIFCPWSFAAEARQLLDLPQGDTSFATIRDTVRRGKGAICQDKWGNPLHYCEQLLGTLPTKRRAHFVDFGKPRPSANYAVRVYVITDTGGRILLVEKQYMYR